MAYIDNEGVMHDDGLCRGRVRHGDDAPVPRLMMLKTDHEAALASQRQQIIDEMVKPLMDAADNMRISHGCDDISCFKCQHNAVCHEVAFKQIVDALAAVESKLEGEKQKETK